MGKITVIKEKEADIKGRTNFIFVILEEENGCKIHNIISCTSLNEIESEIMRDNLKYFKDKDKKVSIYAGKNCHAGYDLIGPIIELRSII